LTASRENVGAVLLLRYQETCQVTGFASDNVLPWIQRHVATSVSPWIYSARYVGPWCSLQNYAVTYWASA